MEISRSAREYVTWELTGLPEDYASGLEVTFDGGTSWHPADVVTEGATKRARVLLAGPNATSNPPGTITLAAVTRYEPEVRLTDNPEVVIRDAGVIYVT